MKDTKDTDRNDSSPPNPTQYNALIRESAISRGMATPETDEEFAILEKSVEFTTLPVHNFEDVLKLITSGESPELKVITFPPRVDMGVVEELAQAARNGTEISPEIKDQMEADRTQAEQDRRKI